MWGKKQRTPFYQDAEVRGFIADHPIEVRGYSDIQQYRRDSVDLYRCGYVPLVVTPTQFVAAPLLVTYKHVKA